MSVRVVVVGAGIIGLAAARELAGRGAAVTVVERHLAGAGTSSRGEGNMLVSDKEIPAEARLALRSLALWEEFATTSAEPFEYQQKGGIITASTSAQLDLLVAQAARQRALGIDSSVLSQEALADREPGLARTLAGGIWFPQDAQVMPIHAVRALRRASLDLGVTERAGVSATGLARRSGGVRLQLSDGSTIDADAVVVAAGPWSGEVAGALGGVAPVFPRRGLLLVTEPMPPGTVRHKVYDGRYVEAVASDHVAAQVAPVVESTESGTILIGSTREAVGWDTELRWDLAGQLARDAIALFPGLARAQAIRAYQGFRPATPDHLPLIGPDVRVEGLFHDSGHEGAGIGLALASAEVLADAVLDGRVEPAFDPRRLGEADVGDRIGAPVAHLPVAVGSSGPTSAPGAAELVPAAGLSPPAGARRAVGGCAGLGSRSGDPAPIDALGGVGASTVAAALLGDGVPAWRTTRLRGRPRGVFCGIGHCHDCVLPDAEGVTVRACLEPARADGALPSQGHGDGDVGAEVDVDVDVLVVGAGVGGLAAAAEVAAAHLSVAVVDRYDAAGGQIARQPGGAERPTGPWADVIARGTAGTTHHLAATSVVSVRRLTDVSPRRFEALLIRDGRLQAAHADHLVLASGAREVVAPFPGWTLPGVVTAGALQALVKREGTSPWPRVGLAGSGPLLLAVADAVRAAGTAPTFLLEAGSLWRLAGAGIPVALRHPTKAASFARLTGLHPPRFGWRVLEAVGEDRVRAAVIGDRRGRTRTVALDALAVSDGLVPDVTLAVQLGCRTSRPPGTAGPAVTVDADQRTSVEGVLAVGEVTGVGGAEKSVAEGRLAGAVVVAAMGGPDVRPGLAEDAHRWRAFAGALARTYPWDDGWAEELPDDEVVCRCEEVVIADVRRAVADGATTARAIKGLTRCGMGRCQGAVCGPLIASALRAAGHGDPGDLEQRPLAAPVTLCELGRLGDGHDS